MKKLKLFVMSVVAMFVAVVGVTAAPKYVSSPAAIAEAFGGDSYAQVDGNVITLKQNIKFNDDLLINSIADPITLDLKNYNIELGNENQILLYSNVTLTIKGTGTISNNGMYTTLEINGDNNVLIIDGPTIENKFTTALGADGLINGVAVGTGLNMNVEHYGGCIAGTTNTLEIKSGIIRGTQGINFNVDGTGTLKISGGTIEATAGTAVVVNGNLKGTATAEITGGTIKSIAEDGFGLAVHGRTTTTIDGGKFTGWTGIYAAVDSNVTINNAAEVTGTQYGAYASGDSVVTINGGKISGAEAGVYSEGKTLSVTDGTISGRYGLVAYNGANATISGGDITGEAAAVSGNGSDPSADTTITVSGGTLKGGIVGIYHPQKGKLNITGDAIIEGKVGIVARQGDVSITGGEINATGNGDNITIGDAKGDDGASRVELPSGVAVIVDNSEDAGYADEANVTITNTDNDGVVSVPRFNVPDGKEPILSYEDEENENKYIEVSGGEFSEEVPNEYLSENVTTTEEDGITYVGNKSTITVAGTTHGTVTADREIAVTGQTVTLTIKADKGYELGTLIINYNGEDHVISGNTFEMPDSNVTVKTIFNKIHYVVPGTDTTEEKLEIVVEEPAGDKEVTLSTETNEVLKESLTNTEDEKLQALLENENVTVELKANDVKKEDVAKEEVEKFENVVKGATVAEYFDLDILVTAGGKTEYLTELSKPITLTIDLPELPEVAEGYVRTYYILREHEGAYEKLNATLENGKLTFATDKFSRYAIAYVDEKVKNPNTGDNIVNSIAMSIISLVGLAGYGLYLNKKQLQK